MFQPHRLVPAILLFVCLICAAKANSQNSGSFVFEGLARESNALHIEKNAPPPPDCPNGPPCPEVLAVSFYPSTSQFRLFKRNSPAVASRPLRRRVLSGSISIIRDELKLSEQDRFAILFSPSTATTLNELTLLIYQGEELKYQSNSRCSGCGRPYKVVRNPRENFTTGYLFTLDDRMQRAIDKYKDDADRTVLIITAQAEETELNKDDFFFVRKRTNKVVRPRSNIKTPKLIPKTNQKTKPR